MGFSSPNEKIKGMYCTYENVMDELKNKTDEKRVKPLPVNKYNEYI